MVDWCPNEEASQAGPKLYNNKKNKYDTFLINFIAQFKSK